MIHTEGSDAGIIILKLAVGVRAASQVYAHSTQTSRQSSLEGQRGSSVCSRMLSLHALWDLNLKISVAKKITVIPDNKYFLWKEITFALEPKSSPQSTECNFETQGLEVMSCNWMMLDCCLHWLNWSSFFSVLLNDLHFCVVVVVLILVWFGFVGIFFL